MKFSPQALQFRGLLLHPFPGRLITDRDLQTSPKEHSNQRGIADSHTNDSDGIAMEGLKIFSNGGH